MKTLEEKFDKLILELKEARLNEKNYIYDEILSKLLDVVNKNEIPTWKVWLIFNQENGNLRYFMSKYALEVKNEIKQVHDGGNSELHRDIIWYPYGIMLESGYYYLNNGFN